MNSNFSIKHFYRGTCWFRKCPHDSETTNQFSGKKINQFNKNIKQAVCCHEDQTAVWQNFYFVINGIDVHKTAHVHCMKEEPSCYLWRAKMKTSTSGQNFNFHFAALPIMCNFFLINLLQKELGFVMGVIYYAARYSSGNVVIILKSILYVYL